MADRTALIAGATGLVGKDLLELMLEKGYYSKVKILSRRPLEYADPRVEVIVTDQFDNLEPLREKLVAHDVFCTLGTTIKKADSKEEFKKVDLDYPLALASVARGFPHFKQYLVVTAAGSNSGSPLFYNKVKGELEDGLKQMGLPGLKIFRPSLLLGHRQEFRLGEEVAKVVSGILTFFMVGLKRRLWAIHSYDVAKAIHVVAIEGRPGTKVYSSSDILKIVNTQGL